MKSKTKYILYVDDKEIIAEVTVPYNSPADAAYLDQVYKKVPLKEWQKK